MLLHLRVLIIASFLRPDCFNQLSECLLPYLFLLVELLLRNDLIEVVDRIVSHHVVLVWALNVENLDIESAQVGNYDTCGHKVFLDLS